VKTVYSSTVEKKDSEVNRLRPSGVMQTENGRARGVERV